MQSVTPSRTNRSRILGTLGKVAFAVAAAVAALQVLVFTITWNTPVVIFNLILAPISLAGGLISWLLFRQQGNRLRRYALLLIIGSFVSWVVAYDVIFSAHEALGIDF